MTIWRMRISCWILKTTNKTLRTCNTYCFSTATIVARTHMDVTLYEQCLYCYKGDTVCSLRGTDWIFTCMFPVNSALIGFPLSVSVHQCSTLPCQYQSTNAPLSPVSTIPPMLHTISIYMLLLPAGLKRETFHKVMLFRKTGSIR
jgi:hypothetical protein